LSDENRVFGGVEPANGGETGVLKKLYIGGEEL
jgi:hypothetical protein